MTNGQSGQQKDTLYIDVDDEITTVIDKLRSSPHRIVALVLPKRAAMFQSIVNMKLLKRTADEAKKHVVLITAEAGLLPLAGAVGLHVAKTLQSRPEIPPPPSRTPSPSSSAAATAPPADDEPSLDASKPVGDLVDGTTSEDDIELDNSAPAAASGKAAKAPKGKKAKKPSIPNFDSFRKRLLLGGVALMLLIVGWVLAFKVLPKATVTLETDTSNIELDLMFTADTSVQTLDQAKSAIPALKKESRKTDTEKVPATGQKDLGTKASGQVTLALKDCSVQQLTVPAGTTITADNLAFVTGESAALQSVQVGNQCQNHNFQNFSTKKVQVTSATPGEQFNLPASKTFGVSGYSAVSGSNDAAFTGGTSKIVKIVSQGDIDSAKQKITDRSNTDASKDLQEEFDEEGYHALTETLAAPDPTVTSTNKVGEEATEVTVTSTVNSTMFGIKKSDLKQYVETAAKEDLDESKQQIIDNGIAKATFRQHEKVSDTQTKISFRPLVVAGPKLDDAAIKKEIAGKRRGEAQDIIKKRPGIKDVEIAYSPFWVQTTPGSTAKIKIVFKQTNNNANKQD